jgi:hypothetical protein
MSASQNPLTVADRSPTEAFIRDLYALAAFYVTHPEHPRPTSIVVHHDRVRPAQLEEVAQRYQVDIWTSKDHRICQHFIADTSTDIGLLVAERMDVRR